MAPASSGPKSAFHSGSTVFLLRRNLAELFSVNFFVVSQTNPYISAQHARARHATRYLQQTCLPAVGAACLPAVLLLRACFLLFVFHPELTPFYPSPSSYLSLPIPTHPYPPLPHPPVPIWRLLRAPPLMRCGFTRAIGRMLEGEFRHWCVLGATRGIMGRGMGTLGRGARMGTHVPSFLLC